MTKEPIPSQRITFNPTPFYTPRIWHGMSLGAWYGMLRRFRYRVHPAAWGVAVSAGLTCTANSFLNWLTARLFARSSERAPWAGDPVFVLGHWRSGTTLLHEMMALDPNFASPTMYQCFVPLHFLLTQRVVPYLFWYLLPKKRPMDDMELGWFRPQEDEFAILNMGVPSPYVRIGFPDQPPRHLDYLSLRGVPEQERNVWKSSWLQFLRYLNYHYQKPLILKSPTHTGRVKTLLEMFPNAQFIHIARDPHKVIPSTIHLWKSLDFANWISSGTEWEVEQYVFDCFRRLTQSYHQDRHLIPANQLVEIRFEDLVKDKRGTLQSVYEKLGLPGFDVIAPQIRDLENDRKAYQRNKFVPDEDLKNRINQECRSYMEEYGYLG